MDTNTVTSQVTREGHNNIQEGGGGTVGSHGEAAGATLTLQLLDLLHVDLQLFLQLPFILLQLLHQLLEVLQSTQEHTQDPQTACRRGPRTEVC